jgi:hypothetical protein
MYGFLFSSSATHDLNKSFFLEFGINFTDITEDLDLSMYITDNNINVEGNMVLVV